MNEEKWYTNMDNLPKDGSILDIIITDNQVDKPLGLLTGIVMNGKIMMRRGIYSDKLMDITREVKKWHKVPNIIQKSDNLLYWDEDNL